MRTILQELIRLTIFSVIMFTICYIWSLQWDYIHFINYTVQIDWHKAIPILIISVFVYQLAKFITKQIFKVFKEYDDENR